MSYCRFGQDGSQVYVYESIDGGYECCGCSLNPKYTNFGTIQEMIDHLQEHIKKGDMVPDYAVKRLKEELEEIK